MAKSNMTPTARKTEQGLVLQDDDMIGTNVLYKGAEINLPSTLRSLEAQGLITMESFVELVDGRAPDRSGLRITPTRGENGVAAPKVIATLIQSLFPQTLATEAAKMAATVDAIEITNAGALNILCRTGQNPLNVARMESILTDKEPVSELSETTSRSAKGRFSQHEGGFSRSGTPSGHAAQVHGRGGYSSGTSSGRG